MSARFGRYEILQPLGRGGMAEVFLARYVGPEGFEKRLVIKRVLPRLSDERHLLRMFFEEARTHVSLSHGNLVSVFDFGRVGNEYFIAMEHVSGGDLATLLAAERAAGRPLPPPLVAYIGIELCRGLAYVHRRGFVHRDVSPRNVLLSADGEVKLSDFGLVLNAASEAAPGVRGTLAYTPPEQARGERVDARSDLYALGVVLAEALSGQRLRDTGDTQTALAVAREGAPLELDGPLGTVLTRATQTSPDDRFASADEMLSALEAESALLGEGRERSVRELARRIGELPAPRAVPPSAPGMPRQADPATAPTAPAVGATADHRGDKHRPAPPPSSLEETYFRDHQSGSFVDEVLGTTPAAPPRRPIAWLVATTAALAALTAGGVAWRGARSTATVTPLRSVENTASAPREKPPAPAVPQPIATPPALQPAPQSSPQVAPTPPAQSDPPRAVRRPTTNSAQIKTSPARTPVAESGTLLLHCTPWCIPFVDGSARGADGRNHTLVLPAGRHRVEARRLEDHFERTVEVHPGQSQNLDFTFTFKFD